jgi:hypothetical protein
MHSTSYQSKRKQHDSDWGWYEEDLKPHHRLVSETDQYRDGGLGPHAARPSFDPQPAVYGGFV